MESLYPAGPQAVPPTLTQPGAQYKKHAWLAVVSLLVFAALYFALLGWFGWTAYRLIETAQSSSVGFFLYILGGCSAFLALFMAKALFFVNRGGAPDDIELTSLGQPQLFAFLNQLADEAGAPRPARVFVSARVNAAVFYDLSILNFIFPSRKNLEIGLALVNVLTISEFKAVLAHEFGHFAQRSMAIGSWVYIAQQIAAHVVAKRDALDKMLNWLARVDLRVAWLGWILQLIVWSIRSLMDTVFRFVVLAQRALSRQMEFQADLVAVSLTGSDELIHALHKLQAADEAWSRSLDFANAEAREGRGTKDLFTVQSAIIAKMARILDDADYGCVPAAKSAKPEQHRVFNSGFAQPPQMWSTHPANADREANAKRHYLRAPHDPRSAWTIFKNPEKLREKVSAHLVRGASLEMADPAVSTQKLNEHYGLMQYHPIYCGTYLGRTLTRHYHEPRELYEAVALADNDVKAALATLYPDSIKNDLTRLRDLEEERALLVALRDKVYQATGGQIMYRGKAITRRELPAAIRIVSAETDKVRGRILAHDRQCRAAHIAAAEKIGAGWANYLRGLIAVLHYAEHTLADVQDAHGLLDNVMAIVTADGKVSAKEIQRLVGVANELHTVLETAYGHAIAVMLDPSLTARLKCERWSGMLEEFKLPPADEGNIGDWLQVINGWVNTLTSALSRLATETLEQILASEVKIARQLREGTATPAPQPSRVPAQYTRLLPGMERKRQKRLGLWDRFQTADGVIPATARLLVAGAIVGTVLGFGSLAGSTADVTIYNGLGTQVNLVLGDQRVSVGRFGSTTVEVSHDGALHVEARNRSGELIESFEAELPAKGAHYVYNVAAASPLVEWTATYGSGKEEAPRMLGALRWKEVDVDFYFREPPESISTKGQGGTRTVISGAGERDPRELLEAVNTAAQQQDMVRAHARWDDDTTQHAASWKAIAARMNGSN